MGSTFRARVRKGRLVLDEPTELPDGTEVELVVGEVAANAPRPQRVAALVRLFELFEGHDARAEIASLKLEDKGF